MQNYVNISLKVSEALTDMAVAYLSLFSHEGIEEKDNELVICFKEENWNQAIKNNLVNTLKSLDEGIEIIDENKVSEQNWNEIWEKEVPVVRVSQTIGIAPSNKIDKLDTKIKIEINPKMSFGTGTHASTRLMCMMMEKYLVPDTHWIDVGCGTGVLSILAVKLGAKKVIAFDNNEWAIMNSGENFNLNNVGNTVELYNWDIDDQLMPGCDGILANLNLDIVLNNIPKFSVALKSSKGLLIVSGILYENLDEVIENASFNGFNHVETARDEEWISIVFKVANE